MEGIKRLTVVFFVLLLSATAWGGPTSSNNPHANSPGDSSDGDGCGCGSSKGMPTYSFKSMLAGLTLRDTPFSYTPPFGPEMDFTLRYNSRDDDQPDAFQIFNVSRRWNLN